MDRVAIIGLGLIGSSIGLALKKAGGRGLEIVGTDKDSSVAAKSSSIGAVDKTISDPRSAVEGARIVILATPVMAMRDVMEAIGSRLDEGTVVTDTGSTKGAVLKWAEELLPARVSFVGGHPMAGREASGPGFADPAIFKGVRYCVVPGKGATPEAVKTVVRMIQMIKAEPLYIDAQEHDGYVAAASHLPMLLSTALVHATAKSPAWSQISSLASSGYRDMSRLAGGDPEVHRDICITNVEPIVAWLDEIIRELYDLRSQVSNGGDKLLKTFIESWESRALWIYGRQRDEKKPDIPGVGENMANLFIGDRLVGKVKEITGLFKRDPTKYKEGME